MQKNFLELPPQFIIFDTEYTAWEGAMERDWSGPNEYREIVQIGAILSDRETFSERGSFNVFVKPVKNPVLSEFFTNLTEISQERVNREGVTLQTALEKFRAWAGERELFSYGWDRDAIEKNCTLIGIAFPFDRAKFHDIRPLFAAAGIPTTQYASGTITRAFGKEPEFRGHDALNDVCTLLEGVKLLAERTG